MQAMAIVVANFSRTVWGGLLATLLLSCQTATSEELASPRSPPSAQERPRARQLGIEIGEHQPGPFNAITDVPGVTVGHETLIEGDHIRTGITIVRPHAGNLYAERVPAALVVANGYGKLFGSTQVEELGELESPIALTNTLSVGHVAAALTAHMLRIPGNERVRSVNVVVGETNDGRLNDIRGQHVTAAHVESALAKSQAGPVAEGSVGAGTGTVCFGYKGGIGTSSRIVGQWTVGVLVQSNFGGTLRVDGRQPKAPTPGNEDGSCMILVATNAPLDTRNLRRLGNRAFAGMARIGASFSNGSGDYAIAFSTAKSQRRTKGPRVGGPVLHNAKMSPLFCAVADATEEAILNSLLQASPIKSRFGSASPIPIATIRNL